MIGLDKKLAEALLAQKIISDKKLDKLSQKAKQENKNLKDVLIEENIFTEEEIIITLAEITGIPYVDVGDYLLKEEVVKLIPEKLARQAKLIPLFKIQDNLTVAMEDPTDILVMDQLKTHCKCNIEPIFASRESIACAIDQYYGKAGSLEEVMEKIDARSLGVKENGEVDIKHLKDVVEEAPVVKMVNYLISQAIAERASDIHIEPEEHKLMVRYRIDGILYDTPYPPKYLQAAIISRIKILAKLDISETRSAQDGRFKMNIEGRDINIRVSVFPTINGENVVMRLLDKSSALFSLNQLGFSEEMLKKYESLIKRPYGITLVTGPTGSGKTTTLYASLNVINSPAKNIITIEDPIEYRLPLIRQSQVNPKANLTFANGLRSILRQDPDIIMVGEIRDVETAEISIQAALTGHLVFSTLHTNDAAGALTRLVDMKVEPFLISSSVIGVLAQRLVRRICDDCKQSYVPSDEIFKEIGIEKKKELSFYKGKGCKKCKGTGYKGRIGIFELLLIDDEIRDLVVSRSNSVIIKQQAVKAGMKTLMDDGLDKVLKGFTTFEEVLQVTLV